VPHHAYRNLATNGTLKPAQLLGALGGSGVLTATSAAPSSRAAVVSLYIDSARPLFISFAVRRSLVRIISARDMTRKEARIYEQTKE
jgi:uncharacterized DUF497 family protein